MVGSLEKMIEESVHLGAQKVIEALKENYYMLLSPAEEVGVIEVVAAQLEDLKLISSKKRCIDLEWSSLTKKGNEFGYSRAVQIAVQVLDLAINTVAEIQEKYAQNNEIIHGDVQTFIGSYVIAYRDKRLRELPVIYEDMERDNIHHIFYGLSLAFHIAKYFSI